MRRHEQALQNVRKIAVLRANALGDYIFSLPALYALKSTYPDAELVYLGNAWHRDFLADRPGPVDRVVVVPPFVRLHGERRDNVEMRALEAFFTTMRAESFDLAVQMHGGGENSNPFVLQLGARVTAGFRADDAPPLDRNLAYALYHNEVLRHLDIARTVGAPPVTVEPEIAVTGRDHHELNAALPGLRKPFAVLHPGATDVRRRWPAHRMAAVADALAARGLHVYVTGVPCEADIVTDVVNNARRNPVNLCGRLSLNAMTALLAQAKLLVSNDTGPLHLARAVGAATVGIYWVGNVINAGPVSFRNHRHCMSWTTACPRCGMDCIRFDAHVPRDGCTHAVSFLGSIETDQVMEQVDALLSQRESLLQAAG